MTMWEQLEPGEFWTPPKNFLMLVPTILLLLTLVSSNYSTMVMALHVPLWAVLILAKLPAMSGVRIFRINATTGEKKKSLSG